MSRESILIVIGVLIAIAPFSGLPHAWLALLLPALGLICGTIGYAFRQEKVRAAPSTFDVPLAAPSRVA